MRWFVLILLTSCTAPRFTDRTNEALRAGLERMSDRHGDTICMGDSYDWFHYEHGIHLNCKHD